MLLLMGNTVYMAFNSIMTLTSTGFDAISTALSRNHRLNWHSRMTMMAIGGGLMLFVLWRVSSMGMLGAAVAEIPAIKPPVFFVRE
jgi:predicted lysophospholipase L1 biosynthesis ABC-type transport system permease subunit